MHAWLSQIAFRSVFRSGRTVLASPLAGLLPARPFSSWSQAGAYQHPAQVVADTDLTLNEKRAVLASWASDACAVEASPELRQPTDGPPILYDTIMEALRKLDGEAAQKTNYGRLINRARRI